MKPIRLELAGLQSYREKQTVDFERLCQGGVFGIFGPTGSGKSSILDAMTLALYGKVERAPKGTQGILNGAESKLSVAFTFELAGAGERVRYRVERQYKRAGEANVHGALCRLIEARPEGDRVLADKQNEVDAAVERLIGLTMPDFTRAVVLPQGKFAEFLTLTGKDRRQMLQRLFRLERYGDLLAARLSARVDAVRVALRETEAEQQGLGDASPEALQAALDRLAEAKQAAGKLREELLKAESEHEALSRRRERRLELERVEKQLAELDAEAPRIAEQEALLEKLKHAERVSPAILDNDEAERDAAVRREERIAAEAGRAAGSKEADEAAAGWMAAQEEAAKREPELILRAERLSQAVKLEDEAAEWETKRKEASSELVHTESRGEEVERAFAEEADRLQRAKAKQAQLRAQWEELGPQAESAGRLQQAAARKEQAMEAARQEEEAEREAADWRDKLAKAQERKAAAETAADLARRQGAALRSRHEEAAERAEELVGRIGLLIQAAEEASRRDQQAHAAAHLAEGLREGEACPVCGSTAHPRLASAASSAAAAEVEAASVWTDALRTLEATEKELDAAVERTAWYADRLRSRLSEADEDGLLPSASEGQTPDDPLLREAAATAELQPLIFSKTPDHPAEWREELDVISRYSKEWRELSGSVVSLQERWESEVQASMREQELAKEAEASAAATSAQFRDKLARLAEQARVLREAWDRDYPDLPFADVQALALSAAEAEKEARTLRERLDKSVDFVGELDERLRAMEREKQALAVRRAELRARSEAIAASADAVAAKLREWTGGAPAREMLAEAERERARLQSALAAARSRHDAAQRKLQEAEAAKTAAAERAIAADDRLRRTSARLAEAIASSGFGDAAEIRPLVDRLSEMPILAEEIERHRGLRQQLTGQAKLLKEALGDEPATEEAWAESAARLSALKRELELAAESAAKVERDAEDLTSRRDRWERLETRRASLAEESGRMAQLQSVFRGNAFVEYVAEEQLEQVCRSASERLGYLTRRRYALEVDAGGGFVIRDDANGGLRRPVSTLSGGETFLTSLALALALSAQIQLRGRYPLQFFFLDEGFGTLDPELLDTVVTSLEKLQQDELAVGIISHVPELQARLPRRLVVAPAEPGGRGSRISYDTI